MCATVECSGLSRQEFAEKVGCGTSQIFKYQKEGLPPRMNKLVRASILEMEMEMGVLPESAAILAASTAAEPPHKRARRPRSQDRHSLQSYLEGALG